MNRRNLFKMLGALAVGAVCAPLVKLLPEDRPQLTVNRPPAPGFRTVYRRQRLDAMLEMNRQMEADLKRATGIFERTLEAEKNMRNEALADLKFLAGV